MATQKWIGGTVGLTWTSAGFGTEINSLANGSAVIAGTQLTNASNLDVFADLSISLGSVATGSGAPYIGFYLYPLNQDGTTYGDNNFTSATAATPPSAYFAGSIPCLVSTTAAIVGMIRGILLPPGAFKFVLFNQAGVALAASANTVNYRTYDFAVN